MNAINIPSRRRIAFSIWIPGAPSQIIKPDYIRNLLRITKLRMHNLGIPYEEVIIDRNDAINLNRVLGINKLSTAAHTYAYITYIRLVRMYQYLLGGCVDVYYINPDALIWRLPKRTGLCQLCTMDERTKRISNVNTCDDIIYVNRTDMIILKAILTRIESALGNGRRLNWSSIRQSFMNKFDPLEGIHEFPGFIIDNVLRDNVDLLRTFLSLTSNNPEYPRLNGFSLSNLYDKGYSSAELRKFTELVVKMISRNDL